jgi:hypothetical protein
VAVVLDLILLLELEDDEAGATVVLVVEMCGVVEEVDELDEGVAAGKVLELELDEVKGGEVEVVGGV